MGRNRRYEDRILPGARVVVTVSRADACPVHVDEVHVSYRRHLFGREPVLKGVNLTARPGGVTAIIGRNGAGKTTLFRTILGLQKPDRGRVTISGERSDSFRRRRGIGYVPETVSFPPGWTGLDLLRRGIDLCVPRAERSEALARAVGRVTDQGALEKAIVRCSKGQQQQIRFAFALVGEPSVLLLDEPFSGLDPPARVALRSCVMAAAERGVTTLLASHNLSEVAKVADEIFVLENGQVRPAPTSGTDRASFESQWENFLMEGGA